MAVAIPESEDTEMNMTPMIDLVFQLIIFFLLTLRFEATDYRIDSQLPKDRGLAPTPQLVTDLQPIKVKLFRKNKDDANAAYTKIKIGNVAEYELPKGEWPMGGAEQDTRRKAYDQVYVAVVAKIRELAKAQETAAAQEGRSIKGEIAVPPPDGPAVPHGDVVRTLDAFIEAGVTDVVFEGAAEPPGAPAAG